MREKERAAEEARRKRGAMTGREIFAEVRAEAVLEHSDDIPPDFALDRHTKLAKLSNLWRRAGRLAFSGEITLRSQVKTIGFAFKAG